MLFRRNYVSLITMLSACILRRTTLFQSHTNTGPLADQDSNVASDAILVNVSL